MRASDSSASTTWPARLFSASSSSRRQRRVALEDELAEALLLERERERGLQRLGDGGAGGREDDALGPGAEEEARPDVAGLADERDRRLDGGVADAVVVARGGEHGDRAAELLLAGGRALLAQHEPGHPQHDEEEERHRADGDHRDLEPAAPLVLDEQDHRRGQRRGAEQGEATRRERRRSAVRSSARESWRIDGASAAAPKAM